MIQDTLYAEYIKERMDCDVLENETGFITYRIIGQECFIADMYVPARLRTAGKGRSLVGELEEIAKLKGCKFISATIYLKDGGASNTLTAALLVGFRVIAADQGVLTIIKETQE